MNRSLEKRLSLEAIDRLFPGFGHDTHGVENHAGTYQIQCLRPGN